MTCPIHKTAYVVTPAGGGFSFLFCNADDHCGWLALSIAVPSKDNPRQLLWKNIRLKHPSGMQPAGGTQQPLLFAGPAPKEHKPLCVSYSSVADFPCNCGAVK